MGRSSPAWTWTPPGTTPPPPRVTWYAYLPATAHGGHAVALVGYTSEHFIVRNSWGTGWGDQGYAYASLAYVQTAFKEAYGVVI